MAVGATPGSRVRPWTCPCVGGTAPPSCSRMHTFWECPVAVAVRGQLESGLGGLTVQRSAVWLLDPPSPSVDARAWPLVAMAAVAAMDYGRRMLWARRREDPAPLLAVAHLSVARFWRVIAEFAAVTRAPPRGWAVGPQHPFLRLVADCLEVSLPGGAPVVPACPACS